MTCKQQNERECKVACINRPHVLQATFSDTHWLTRVFLTWMTLTRYTEALRSTLNSSESSFPDLFAKLNHHLTSPFLKYNLKCFCSHLDTGQQIVGLIIFWRIVLSQLAAEGLNIIPFASQPRLFSQHYNIIHPLVLAFCHILTATFLKFRLRAANWMWMHLESDQEQRWWIPLW